MQNQPWIGLTTYAIDDKGRYMLPFEYVRAVETAGGIPILLPPGETPIPALLQRLDGVVLTGGGDINPALYDGDTHHAQLYGLSETRDRFEFALTKALIHSSIPVLAICRGMQFLNIVLGGSLHEHLPDVVGDTLPHRAEPSGPISHTVRVRPDSALSVLLGEQPLTVASWHHQSIRYLGSGLRISAEASDGTIEAVELGTHPWCIGVQWHPEIVGADSSRQEALWKDFISSSQNKHF
ncbi:MAG: gamma-glutamyl-gamma-aminobutyrate hydrolase family protein [Acidithiobacillus sp.]|jgi:putative glutamine amidotransferase|uniref:gamma-glutamyl-gamma-aminobutyrate hydrolase family protein n=1 Tax=Acidithiobacillus sp. TaxID=1872118 RepID=UPI00356AF9D6